MNKRIVERRDRQEVEGSNARRRWCLRAMDSADHGPPQGPAGSLTR